MADNAKVALNVVAIIQARMGSRRFPGKVLADLRGRPVLEWVVDAIKKVEGVDDIVVATTTNKEDQAIVDWCAGKDVNCFRGEPLDVLKRYTDCAKEYKASHILRITADCPLLDPETVSAVLREGLESGADYFGLAGEFPDGFDCEGFTIQAIVLADKYATTKLDREHVTTIMKSATNQFSKHEVCLFSGLDHIRLTVDESLDLDFLDLVLAKAEFRGHFPEAKKLLQVVKSLQPNEILNRGIARNAGLVWSLEQES